MPLRSIFRRSSHNTDQLDLFSGATCTMPPLPAAAVAEIVPEPQPLVQTEQVAAVHPEPEAQPPAAQPDYTGEPVILDLPDNKPSRDFRITDAHRIGQGGLAEKARDNVAAIRTLKAIEAEEREATEDEKATLVRYVGWGAMAKIFDRWQPDHLTSTAEAVKSLLTDSEYASARASTPNAHYTSPMVIKAVWDGLRHIGVGTGAQILEPAMGVGHFFCMMPDDMKGGHRTGVELDSITARIAKQLYPDASIFEKGFEETPLPDNYFDVAVGNVPFGDYAVHDPAMKHGMTRAMIVMLWRGPL